MTVLQLFDDRNRLALPDLPCSGFNAASSFCVFLALSPSTGPLSSLFFFYSAELTKVIFVALALYFFAGLPQLILGAG